MDDPFPFATCPCCKHSLIGSALWNAGPLLLGMSALRCPCCGARLKLAKTPLFYFLLATAAFALAFYSSGANPKLLIHNLPAELAAFFAGTCAMIMGLVFIRFVPGSKRKGVIQTRTRMLYPNVG